MSDTEKRSCLKFTANEILSKKECQSGTISFSPHPLSYSCKRSLQTLASIGVCPSQVWQNFGAQNIFVYRGPPKSGLCKSATCFSCENEPYLSAGLACQTVPWLAVRLAVQNLRTDALDVQTRGTHSWGLTWGGTQASGPGAHATLEMQNLSSGIYPRSPTTSV